MQKSVRVELEVWRGLCWGLGRGTRDQRRRAKMHLLQQAARFTDGVSEENAARGVTGRTRKRLIAAGCWGSPTVDWDVRVGLGLLARRMPGFLVGVGACGVATAIGKVWVWRQQRKQHSTRKKARIFVQ